nr:hypothetical protein CFP56_65319 [Quercus suber]
MHYTDSRNVNGFDNATQNEAAVQSREEDEELERSTKKVKENHSQGTTSCPASLRTDGRGGGFSYKEKLVREIPGAFEQAFAFENDMETEVESNDETLNIEVGIAAVNLLGERKASIRAHWSNALIVKVIGKTVGYQIMSTRLLSLWKPSGCMDCVDLGEGFFLIKFSTKKYYGRALKDSPWHKEEICPYRVSMSEMAGRDDANGEILKGKEATPFDKSYPKNDNFGPWVLVAQKKKFSRDFGTETAQPSYFGHQGPSKDGPNQTLSPTRPKFVLSEAERSDGVRDHVTHTASRDPFADRTIPFNGED